MASSGTASAYTSRTAAIKIDTIDDETLQNIADDFENQTDHEHMQKVRPWIYGDYGRSVIDPICQFGFYKCMHESCIYATNSMEHWFIHMKKHLQLIDYLDKRAGGLGKALREKYIKFRECPYCGYEAKADHDVIIHMEEEHRRSIFQCSLCFYRSIEMDNLVMHMQICHAASGRNEIYVCGDVREFEQQDEDILEQDIDANVTKIVCGQGINGNVVNWQTDNFS